ncbi:glycosyltransferase involved in cell wall biosynthesis [Marinobacter sp. 3-2]|jgi:glycosyltransferase involved in cell wall biosynthesis|uniref:glycosyltransferase family 4 protein n=1 Tax=Marinobacter sp. 3-2 TaxID=2485141 RepID=UPI000D3DB88A|nr:glycosyltransferase family 4 protein [Marinobacter sp. 3-2]ROQ46668.1 glycosyltransferase involved in cell wall biosynthesis [Marinobacter sp. 3-2]
MKTVLHLIDTTGPGGAETVFINLLKKMQVSRLNNVVVLRGKGWVSERVMELGIQPVFLDSKGSFNFSYISELRRLVRERRVDLIHAHLLGSNVYGAMVALICRKPMIATFHGAVDVAASERFLKAKFAIVGLGASAIVCVSKRLQDELRHRSSLPDKKLRLIYNGVDPDLFFRSQASGLRYELGLPPHATIVVSVGNIRPAKGYEYLVEAAVALAERDPLVHFVVVGHQREELFAKLSHQIAQADNYPNIHWLGFRDDVVNILRQADIFLLPSVSEGFSISTVEAMMASIPIVATRSGGPEEILRDTETGLLVPVRDPGAIVSAIARLSDQGLRAQLGQDARNDALRRFSLTSMQSAYYELYQCLIGR